MSIELTHGGGVERESAAAIIRRIGHIAGVLAIAAAVFMSLYFFVLYIASES